MKTLDIEFESSEQEVAIDRIIGCDVCRDTGEYEPLDLEGFPSGDYQKCPVCQD